MKTTQREILNEKIREYNNDHSQFHPFVTPVYLFDALISAMDEYAKEESIVFAEWILRNDYRSYDGQITFEDADENKFTATELYKLFKSAGL